MPRAFVILALCSLVPPDAGGLHAAANAPTPPSRPHLALGGVPPVLQDEADLRSFLDDLEAQQFLISVGLDIETYHQWTGKTGHRVAEFTRFANDILSRRDYAAVIEQWRGKVSDPVLARRLELHHRDFLVSRTDPALVRELGDARVDLQDKVGAFRLDVGGEKLTPTAAVALLRTSPDRAVRREAFLAQQQLSAAHARAVLACMRLHDRISRSAGYADGAEAGLDTQGLTKAQALHDLEKFEQDTRPMMAALLKRAREDLGVDQVEPWDLNYWLHLQELKGGTDAWPREAGLPRLRELMTSLGFEPAKLPIDVAVRDVPTGGIAFSVRPGFEARLLTNPFPGSDFYTTLFHEYGHTLNTVLQDPTLPPIFLADEEGPIGEGVAETLGYFAYDPRWLTRVAGVTPAQAEQLARVGRLQQLLWLRQSICLNAYFELRAYDNLDADLDALYAQAYRRFMLMDLPPGSYYGAVDMFAAVPTYATAYLYANLIATQLREAMRKEFGNEDLSQDPRVGPWLTRHFFVLGRSVPWPEKIVRATGHPLTTDALTRYFQHTD